MRVRVRVRVWVRLEPPVELDASEQQVRHRVLRRPERLLRQLVLRLRLRGRLPQQDARNLRERRLARELSLLALLKYARKVRLNLLLCQVERMAQ